MTKLVIFAVITYFGYSSEAAENKSKTQKKEVRLTWDDYRCEQFSDGNLYELKKKLVESCNLLQPHSFSVARDPLSRAEVFYYCCHKNANP